MTSQSSTNKTTAPSLFSLMREDMRHKNWMTTLSILGSFLTGPVAFLLFFSENFGQNVTEEFNLIENKLYTYNGEYVMTLAEYHLSRFRQCARFLQSYHLILALIIAYLGAMIVAFFGFRFLYHKNMVDLYHSAPVSRRKLFTALWLNGILIWFVPAFIGNLCVFILSSLYTKGMYMGNLFGILTVTMLRLTLCYLVVYHVCLLGVMFSGNVINAIVNSLSIGVLVFACAAAVLLLMHTFYDGFYLPYLYLYGNPLYAFSPLYTPFILGYFWMDKNPGSILYFWHLAVGIALMLINLFLAYLSYRKRSSELSERGLENKVLRVLLRTCISVVAGIGFAMIFFMIMGSSRLYWSLFGIFLGSALSFCVLNVIYSCTFKEVFAHKLHYGISLGICILLFFGIMFDVTGYEKRLPKKENIKGLSLYVSTFADGDAYAGLSGDNILYYYGGNSPLPGYVSKDRDAIYALLSDCVNSAEQGFDGYTRVTVKVYTRFGSYYRSYRLPEEHYALLAPFVESKEYADTYYPLKSLRLGMPSYIMLNPTLDRSEMIMDPEKIEALMRALNQDFEEHRTIPDLLRSSRAFNLRMTFEYKKDQYSSISRKNFSYAIPYWYEHTVSLIKDWYPNQKRDPAIDDIEQFVFDGDLPVPKDASLHGILYSTYGFDENGAVLPSPSGKPSQMVRYTAPYCSWSFSASSPEFLRELEPYLIWGIYENPLANDYVCLGTATLMNGGHALCYIQYGKLPLDILRAIEAAAEKSLSPEEVSPEDVNYADYWDGEYYYDGDYYYEDIFYGDFYY